MVWSLRTTLLAIVVSVVAVIAILLSAYFYLDPGQGPIKGLYDKDKVAGATALVGLLLGAVGTLAGAAATIQVALLGLSVARSQERFGVIQYLDRKFEEQVELFASLSLSLSEFMVSAIAADVNLDEAAVNQFKSGNTKVPDSLTDEVEAFQSAFDGLIRAIQKIAMNDLALAAFREKSRAIGLVSPDIVKRQVTLGFSHSEVDLGSDDLISLSQIFRIKQGKFREQPMLELLNARLTSVLPDQLFGAKPFDHRLVRSVIFAGSCLYSRMDFKNGKTVLVLNGLGILRDLARSIPDGAAIKSQLSKRYPNYSHYADELMNSFEPAVILSQHVMDGLNSFEALSLGYVFTTDQNLGVAQ